MYIASCNENTMTLFADRHSMESVRTLCSGDLAIFRKVSDFHYKPVIEEQSETKKMCDCIDTSNGILATEFLIFVLY